jgi:hypothetical protein
MAWVRKTLSGCMNFNTGHNVDFSYNGGKSGVRAEREACGNMGDWFDIDFLAALGGGG